MKIYTKTGDQGETGLFGGARVKKNNLRIAAYGEVDELNAFIGWARVANENPTVDALLKGVQNHLFDLGAVLATPDPTSLAGKGRFIETADIERLEKEMDRMENDLPPLKTFILPGGGELAARLHVVRVVCRRAERQVVALAEKETIEKEAVIYLNRLSDFLFVLARWVNRQAGQEDLLWQRKK